MSSEIDLFGQSEFRVMSATSFLEWRFDAEELHDSEI